MKDIMISLSTFTQRFPFLAVNIVYLYLETFLHYKCGILFKEVELRESWKKLRRRTTP